MAGKAQVAARWLGAAGLFVMKAERAVVGCQISRKLLFDGYRRQPMQYLPPLMGHHLIGGVAHQGMQKDVAQFVERMPDGGLLGLRNLALNPAAVLQHLRQQANLELAAQHRCGVHHPADLLGECVDAGDDQRRNVRGR